MINLDKREWALCRGEKYAIKWLEERGYEVTIRKRFITKDYMTITKDGKSCDFELPLGDKHSSYGKYMPLVEKLFIAETAIRERADR